MDFDLLKKLCETPAVPGREEQLRKMVIAALGPVCDGIEIDVMGNVTASRSGKGKPKVMLAAHMDEIGFLVRHIDDRGFLKLQALGGFDPRQLFAQRVLVHAGDGSVLRGVLSYTTKPTHMQSEEDRKEQPKTEKFFVDLGCDVEDIRDKVRIGDMVTMDRTLERCHNGFIGKALDNRIGLFVMIETMRNLENHDADIFAVATVQEEVGLRGAMTAAYAVAPDIGIAIDTTLANDYPGQQDVDSITRLGGGAGIKIMDSSVICHPLLVDHFREIAERDNIPHQMEILARGGTDAGALQRSRAGAASITLSIPTRYVHTVNEMISRKDVESAVQLLSAYLEESHKRDYRY